MKRFVYTLLCLIAAAALTLLFCLSASAGSYVNGDADGDGEVTSVDTAVIQRVLTGLIADDDGMIALRGDVTGDGLSLPDATAVQYYLAMLRNDYHVGADVVPTQPFVFPTEDNQLPLR